MGGNRADLVTICQNVCGIQAQVMSAAHLAMWARAHHVTKGEIESALWEKRALVKTNCMRGTLHLLTAEDYPIYIAALKGSRARQLQAVMARWGVTAKESAAVEDAAVESLGAGPMTRSLLTRQVLSRVKVRKRARTWFEKSWWGAIYRGIVEGKVCYGAQRGPEITLVRVDQWLPKMKNIPEAEAQPILFRRFLRAYGPATVRDFAKWTGLPMRTARAAMEPVKHDLLEVEVEGRSALILRQDEEQLLKSALDEPVLRLLPNFDTYLLAHAEKDHLVERQHYKKVYRNQGWISPVVLLNGKVIGTWSLARPAKRAATLWRLEIEPFEKLSASLMKRVGAEADSLGKFLDAQWKIVVKN